MRVDHRAVALTVALTALATTACMSAETPPDGGIDAGMIIVPPIYDARIGTAIDARIHDAGPVIDARVFDAFPCIIQPANLNVSTLAGCAAPGIVDGNRNATRFNNPVNAVLGPDKDIYIADFYNNRIRAVKPDGTTRTVVNQPDFRQPYGMAFTPDGTLYVETDEDDSGNYTATSGTLWVVDLAARKATVVLHEAGRPHGMVALDDGRIVLSDPLHHVLRIFNKTTPASDAGPQPPVYSMSSLAGGLNVPGFIDNPASGNARFREPTGVALLGTDRVLVADRGNNRIRVVDLAGGVTTFAGHGEQGRDDGAALSAKFDEPGDVAADSAGNVYVSDLGNHLIRKITDGQVSSIAGDGSFGYEDDDDLMIARFFGMEGIDVNAEGTTLWIADGTRGEDLPYHRVRIVKLP